MNGGEKRSQGHQPDLEFERAAERRSPGIVKEFIGFLSYNQKWWLAPIIIFMLLLGLFVILGGTGFAPFIYTLF
jgi:hypothetical protein